MPLTAFLGRLFGQKRVYMVCLVLFLSRGRSLCGTARRCTALIVYRVMQGLGAGALQPTEQAILRQTFPPKEQGMAMALFGMAVMLGPASARRSAATSSTTTPGRGSSTSTFRRRARPRRWSRHSCTKTKRSSPRTGAGRGAAKEHRLVGHRADGRGLCALQYVLEEGQPDDWFESTIDLVGVSSRARRLRGVRRPGAHVRSAGREHAALQGSGLPLGDDHRLAHVRAAHGDHVLLAAVHAGAARLHRHRRGHRADAARARDDGRRAHRGTHLQRDIAAHRHRRRASCSSRGAPST